MRTLISILLLVTCLGCLPHKKEPTTKGVRTEKEEKKEAQKKTETAIRHTITVAGVLSAAAIFAGACSLIFGLAPSSKFSGWSLIIAGALGVGLSLVLSKYLDQLANVVIGLLISWGVWELVTHYAYLKKKIKEGIDPPATV